MCVYIRIYRRLCQEGIVARMRAGNLIRCPFVCARARAVREKEDRYVGRSSYIVVAGKGRRVEVGLMCKVTADNDVYVRMGLSKWEIGH